MTKHILSLSLALAGAVILPITSFAQDAAKPAAGGGDRPGRGPGGPGGPGGRGGMQQSPEERAKRLKETLNLTDDQVTKITAIYQKAADKMKADAGDNNGDREARRTKMMEAMKQTREEVEAVLTPEQKTKWQAEMEKRRNERGGGRGPGGAGGNKPADAK